MRFAAFGALVIAPAMGAITVYQDDDHPLDDSVRHLFDTASIMFEVNDPKDAEDVSKGMGAVPLPWVFSCGSYVGGAQEVMKLSAAGELKNVADCDLGGSAMPESQQALARREPQQPPVMQEAQQAPTEVVPAMPAKAAQRTSFLEPPPTLTNILASRGLPADSYPAAAGAQVFEYGIPAVTFDANAQSYIYQPPVVNYEMPPASYGVEAAEYAASMYYLTPVMTSNLPPVSYTTATYHEFPAVDYGMSAAGFGAIPMGYAPFAASQFAPSTHVMPGGLGQPAPFNGNYYPDFLVSYP